MAMMVRVMCLRRGWRWAVCLGVQLESIKRVIADFPEVAPLAVTHLLLCSLLARESRG